MSIDLWAPGAGVDVTQVAAELEAPLAQLGRLTISGGEPFEQAAALLALLRLLRRRLDFDVLAYSGYTIEELRAKGGAPAELLDSIDILIDGPYDENAANTLQWRGSDGQRVHALSSRGRSSAAEFDLPMPKQRPLSVQQLPSGGVRVFGIPRRGDIERLFAALAARGVAVVASDETACQSGAK
jgi:anaerobic ribonucleoside-triphosphate reductase activating protein